MEQPNQWNTRADGSAAAAVTLTKAAKTDNRHYVTGFEALVLGAAQAASAVAVSLQEDVGGTPITIWKGAIKASEPIGGGVKESFIPPLEIARSKSISVVVGTPGAGVTLSVQMRGYTKIKR